MNYFETLLRQHAALADRLLAGLPQQATDSARSKPAQAHTAQGRAASQRSMQAYCETETAPRNTQAYRETAQSPRTTQVNRETADTQVFAQADTEAADAQALAQADTEAAVAQVLAQDAHNRMTDRAWAQGHRSASQVFDEVPTVTDAMGRRAALRPLQRVQMQEYTAAGVQLAQPVSGEAIAYTEFLRADAAQLSSIFERDARRYG